MNQEYKFGLESSHESSNAPAEDSVLHTPASERTVLIVDDDTDQLLFFSLLLQRSGYRVLSASSVSEAMAKMTEKPVDLVISDFYMPHQSGRDLLEILRAREATQATRRTPVIIISAADSDVESEMLRCGADWFCPKRDHFSLLIKHVNGLLA